MIDKSVYSSTTRSVLYDFVDRNDDLLLGVSDLKGLDLCLLRVRQIVLPTEVSRLSWFDLVYLYKRLGTSCLQAPLHVPLIR